MNNAPTLIDDTSVYADAQRTSTRRRRFSHLLGAAALSLSTVLGVGLTSVVSAQAATGTTRVTICAHGPQYALRATIDAYWFNGSVWTGAGSTSANSADCAVFTLAHSGYYQFSASTAVLIPCTTYFYEGFSPVVIKQNLPASSSMSVTMNYKGQQSFC